MMRWPDEWKGPYWEPRDIWIGAFIDPSPERVRVYICIVPCFPVRLTWIRRVPSKAERMNDGLPHDA